MVTNQQVEDAFNRALGGLLRPLLRSFEVRSENINVFRGSASRKKPDVLLTAPGKSPVAIECEFRAGVNVEREARERLGHEVEGQIRPVEAAIAVAYPPEIRAVSDAEIPNAVEQAELQYAVHYVGGVRFPQRGWMRGSVPDLAEMVSLVSVPQQSVQKSIEALTHGIEVAATHLDEMASTRAGAARQVARIMEMPESRQSRRIACSVLANALIFQEKLAGVTENYHQVSETSGPGVDNPRRTTIDMWKEILEDNYWPIFAIAKDVLEAVVNEYAAPLLRTLTVAVEQVTDTGIDNTRDLAGHVFQKFVEDREYLAAYYTLPTSASLLAQLAVAKMRGIKWSDRSVITNLKVVDFACGTGALLSAAYEQMWTRYERAGGNPAEIHREMMQNVLHGFDVVPAGVHITGSTLSGAQPTVPYKDSLVYRMPYGALKTGEVATGSLEYLTSGAQITHSNYTNPAIAMGSQGARTSSSVMADAKNGSFDLVIMNPPFKSNTSHEGNEPDVANPAFSGLEGKEEEADAMSKRAKRLARGTCAQGNAGLATLFAALAHLKVKPGGVIALVLPLSVSAGQAWTKFRETLAQQYTDVTVLSIANTKTRMSFSADTGMAECLIIGTRLKEGEEPSRAVFCSLRERPNNYAQATALATVLNRGPERIRSLEGGPYGGTTISVGDDDYGQVVTTPPLSTGYNWPVRTKDYSTGQTAYRLCQGELALPQLVETAGLPISPIQDFARRGIVHRDMNGNDVSKKGKVRGPFNKHNPYTNDLPYPSIWNHSNKDELKIVCQPDCNLVPREGEEDRASEQWEAYASRLHINAEFTFSSQALAVAYTDELAMGGSVWLNVVMHDQRQEQAVALFGNTTLGLLLYWWQSNRQQSSKARLTITNVPTLKTLNPTMLEDTQLDAAAAIFEEFRDTEFMPASRAHTDPKREELDRRVICDMLGLGEVFYDGVRRLSRSLCNEPVLIGR